MNPYSPACDRYRYELQWGHSRVCNCPMSEWRNMHWALSRDLLLWLPSWSTGHTLSDSRRCYIQGQRRFHSSAHLYQGEPPQAWSGVSHPEGEWPVLVWWAEQAAGGRSNQADWYPSRRAHHRTRLCGLLCFRGELFHSCFINLTHRGQDWISTIS